MTLRWKSTPNGHHFVQIDPCLEASISWFDDDKWYVSVVTFGVQTERYFHPTGFASVASAKRWVAVNFG